jgi:hypothetical protein
MLQRLLFTVILLAFGIATASAATQAATTAKIVAIDGNKVQMVLETEKPAWLKKGAVVKVSNAAGEVVEKTGKVIEATDTGFTFTTDEASSLKAGDTLSFQKGKVMTGC